MKLEKLDQRLAILETDPGNTAELDRVLRMIGDELPRYRKSILEATRSRLSALASKLEWNDGKDAIRAASALKATCTLVYCYEVAASERHCSLCDDSLARYYILTLTGSNVPPGHFCYDCIVDAVRKIRPDAVHAFTANRMLDEEPALYADIGEHGKQGFEIRLKTFSRRP